MVFERAASTTYNANVAIDDIALIDCELPRPEDQCGDNKPVRCANNVMKHVNNSDDSNVVQVCIERGQQCDLTDDCGDLSDEDGLFCGENSFLQTNFENNEKPFGIFEQPAPGMFRWERGQGRTDNKGTGPPFDHTTWDNTGHYMYIDSSSTVEQGEKAELVSKTFVPGYGTDNDCEIIFYYHMYGPNVGTLELLMRYGYNPRTNSVDSCDLCVDL